MGSRQMLFEISISPGQDLIPFFGGQPQGFNVVTLMFEFRETVLNFISQCAFLFAPNNRFFRVKCCFVIANQGLPFYLDSFCCGNLCDVVIYDCRTKTLTFFCFKFWPLFHAYMLKLSLWILWMISPWDVAEML